MGESAYHDLPAESQRGNPLRSACTAWYCPHGPKKSIAAALIYCRPSGSLQAALYLYRSGYFPVSLMFFPNCIQLQILEDQITYTHLPIDPAPTATHHSTYRAPQAQPKSHHHREIMASYQINNILKIDVSDVQSASFSVSIDVQEGPDEVHFLDRIQTHTPSRRILTTTGFTSESRLATTSSVSSSWSSLSVMTAPSPSSSAMGRAR